MTPWPTTAYELKDIDGQDFSFSLRDFYRKNPQS